MTNMPAGWTPYQHSVHAREVWAKRKAKTVSMRKPTIEILPPEHNALRWAEHTVRIPNDSYGGEHRILQHDFRSHYVIWQQALTILCPKANQPFLAVDVGANVGLWTRGLIATMPNVQEVWAYEPDLENCEDLKHNLSPWMQDDTNNKVKLWPYALRSQHHLGGAPLYRDHDNCGNFSLLQSAVNGRHHDVVPVQTKGIYAESQHWMKRGLPILYKSDVQGLDEELAINTAPQFWNQTFAAIIELWVIRGKDADTIRDFIDIVYTFPNAMLLGAKRKVSGADVFEFLSQDPDPNISDDLVLWR